MPAIFLVPPVVFFAASAVLIRTIDNKVYKKLWSPQFVCNDVGGMLAICSRDDFEDAKEYGDVIEGKIMVRDTLVFCDRKSAHRSGCFNHGFSSIFYPFEKRNDLFVPFTSEGLLSFAEQELFFTKPRDRDEFVKEKLREARLGDWRLRFALRWRDGRYYNKLFMSATTFSIILGFVLAIMNMSGG